MLTNCEIVGLCETSACQEASVDYVFQTHSVFQVQATKEATRGRGRGGMIIVINN